MDHFFVNYFLGESSFLFHFYATLFATAFYHVMKVFNYFHCSSFSRGVYKSFARVLAIKQLIALNKILHFFSLGCVFGTSAIQSLKSQLITELTSFPCFAQLDRELFSGGVGVNVQLEEKLLK